MWDLSYQIRHWVQAVWWPVFANGFIVSPGLLGSALLGMMKTSDLFI